MSTRISADTFKGLRAWALASDRLRVTILPDLGAKMASLVYLPTGRELLFQRDDWPELKLAPYGADFGDYDVSGFDDMFPTIDVFHYPDGSWEGTRLPDHGEVWALPWRIAVEGDTLVAVVHGRRLPYRLEKRLRLVGDSAVRTDYRVDNLSGEDLLVMWAAHPLCACNESTRIIMPPGVTRVVNTSGASQRFPRYGATAPWPTMTTRDGETYHLDRIGSASLGRSEKYWVDGPLPAGWAALHHADTNEALGFAWPEETVPYLGVWVTEGGYQGLYHVALEPGTAAMDRPDTGRQWGRGSAIPANGRLEWHLILAAGQVSHVTGVTHDGDILSI